MSTPTEPTPLTDAATYPADCLGNALVVHRDCARSFENKLSAATTERDQLRAVFPQICAALGNGAFCTPTVSVGFIESIPNEVELVIAELRARAERAEADAERYRLVTLRQDAELAAERARLDWFHEAAGDSIWVASQDIRAAIDAAMKEKTK